ncbi:MULTISPECIES: helicase-related protein [Methylosinus]|uniref:Helicase n=1 Tax=Methylosinus trichosporium (strain ATCC 35070 / NCIMB 11131 / UNIQEM 75 / OB3b) TaxID=595536 RepID=A0A2D2D6C9_METT3|nr:MULTISPECIES: helicase-related protein [Methylosinus]ATQ70533.1 helicase [Methylosinus trichosporium OB3b]OBS52545.1 helicase [Methylosinus sp. 3S-1]
MSPTLAAHRSASSGLRARAAGVAALLGPTNTGKTHHAIERMLSYPSGMIGLPLRLLAREVYQRVAERVGAANVALVTGEEKIKPRAASYWISTVEAMPRDLDVDFVAVDEIQLAADLDRGHVFTDRLAYWRGRQETLLIGAETMRPLIERLLPGAPIFTRPRLSRLTFAGERKLARLPPRSAIVAFSVEDVYAIAEWIKRQRGGAAVVLGALSPRTRNAQVDLYQNGDVDYLVATDAIGMGLNLDVDHIAFAADRKFDGLRHRRLTPAEFGQIAGRAGRHMSDGAFGTTGRCPPFDEDLIEDLESHRFDPVTLLQWRNADLDFDSIEALVSSLERAPPEDCLARARTGEDQMVLEAAARDDGVRRNAKTHADIMRLWDVCQIPDYRKTSPAAHAELALAVYGFVVRRGLIPGDWFAKQIAGIDRVDGDIHTLSARLAQVRTWTFIANRSGWLENAEHWQSVARQVEDSLSDALHERLTQRFVDRRTSVLMRRLRENAMLEAEITTAGDVMVEGQHVGQLQGFRFTADPQATGEAAKALNSAAQKALAGEIEARATRVFDAVDDAFLLGNDGTIRWLGEPVGKIVPGASVLKPAVRLLADEQLTGAALEKAQHRLDLWLASHVKKLLGALEELESGEGLEGVTRGVAFQLAEELGVLERSRVARDIKGFSQEDRAALRKKGVRFGAYHLYLPALLKPAPRALSALLWGLKHGGLEHLKGLDEVPHLAASGRTSFAADPEISKGFYRAAGFRVCGERVVRVDILERLADLIRPASSYRPGVTPGEPPAGAADGDGFVVTVAMTSLTGCAGEAFGSILRSLGYQSTERAGPAITVALLPAAATEPLKPTPALAEGGEAPAEVETIEAEAAPESAAETITVDVAAPELAEAPATAELVAAEAVDEPIDVSAEPTAEAEGETAAPAEPEAPALIEVWTLQRHTHAGPRRRPQGGPAAPRSDAAAKDGRPARERSGGPRRGPGGERSGEARDGERREATGGEHRPRSDGARKEAGLRGGGKPRSDHRPPRDDDRRRHGGGGYSTQDRREKERQPDPDSPFAKLLALKAELEKKGKS